MSANKRCSDFQLRIYMELFLPLLICSSLLSAKPHNTTITQIMQEKKYHGAILEVLDLIYSQKYDLAESVLETKIPYSEPGHLYFKGLLYCTVFNDYGDTSSLSSAKRQWQKLKKMLEESKDYVKSGKKSTVHPDLYSGLVLIQLSYISSTRKQFLNAALQSKAAVKMLRHQNQYLEAQCANEIYRYYKGELLKLLDWLPFFKVDQDRSRKFLEKNFHRSPYLYAIFLTPLIWMQFDAGSYQQGLQLTRDFLKKYPENRIFRLMEADFYFKMKKYGKSAKIFEEVKQEYSQIYARNQNIKPVKINYLSASGNLLRVYAAMGNKKGQQENAAIWFSEESDKVRKWLPKSLVKDLERFR
ncbi:hypothetical protein ACFL5V_04955 [Fibrobacterota bacterium]